MLTKFKKNAQLRDYFDGKAIGTIIETNLGKTGHGMELRVTSHLSDLQRDILESKGEFKNTGLGFRYQRHFRDDKGVWHKAYWYKAYTPKTFNFCEIFILGNDVENIIDPKPVKKSPAKKSSKKTEPKAKPANNANLKDLAKAIKKLTAEEFETLYAML